MTHKRPAVLSCPQCGNNVHFCSYRFRLTVEDLMQTRAHRFRQTGVLPSPTGCQSSPLLVCSACACPVGPLPSAATITKQQRAK